MKTLTKKKITQIASRLDKYMKKQNATKQRYFRKEK